MLKFFAHNLWRWKCGLKEISLATEKCKSITVLYKCQWSPLFEKYMRNRLALGYFRYGSLRTQAKGKYSNLKSIRQRLDLYQKTGNDEILVDIANLAMVEFVNGNHPKKHFKSIDDGIHTEKN